MWHMGDGWGWWMAMGWIWMLVFWGLIIWGIYALTTRLGRGERASERELSALEILERRYARGELGADEFEDMRRRLTGERAATHSAA
jgi:putative membrane protein